MGNCLCAGVDRRDCMSFGFRLSPIFFPVLKSQSALGVKGQYAIDSPT